MKNIPIEKEIVSGDKHPAFHYLHTLLKPVVRFCLRRSIQIQVLLESVKALFVELAEEELVRLKKDATISRLSVMTGVHRKDVKRIQSTDYAMSTTTSFLTKVIGLWLSDPDFLEKETTPRILTHSKQESEFSSLVSRVSTDLNPATVLFELERHGIIKKSENGIELLAQSLSLHEDEGKALDVLSKDVEHLTAAAEENIFERKSVPNLHRRTEYDNVNPAAVPELKKLLLEEGFRLHKKARDIISRYDRDITPDANFEGKGATVVVGSFSKVYLEEDA